MFTFYIMCERYRMREIILYYIPIVDIGYAKQNGFESRNLIEF